MRCVVGFFLLFFSISAHAQSKQYIIEFTDKANTPYSVSRPLEFLSQRAIARREKQGIPVVENDLPVNPQYIEAIASVDGVKIKNTSKWLNQVYIETNNSEALAQIMALPFVSGNRLMQRAISKSDREEFYPVDGIIHSGKIIGTGEVGDFDYGLSSAQIEVHHGELLHQKGFAGEGMLIAVIDAGFMNYLTLPAFDSLIAENRIIDTFDFVGSNRGGLNREHAHGMSCLSTMAANVPGVMVGSAPHASYLLYRSENAAVEYPGEEQNWIAAAERSDSAGADVIATSLGYNYFDNTSFDYTYEDVDGNTSMMTRGAAIAASKGMILTLAAGNEGNLDWHYILVPADAPNTLTVGAADINGVPGAFSSYGPTFDGRLKPDVSSVGVRTVVQSSGGSFVYGNGTSYAAPNLAGLTACLWQAFPEFSAIEIMDIIRKSGSLYPDHDKQLGFGFPDFGKAYDSLSAIQEERRLIEEEERRKEEEERKRQEEQQRLSNLLRGGHFVVYPNPVTSRSVRLVIDPVSSGEGVIRWYDMKGRLVLSEEKSFSEGQLSDFSMNIGTLLAGTYVVQFILGNHRLVQKVVVR